MHGYRVCTLIVLPSSISQRKVLNCLVDFSPRNNEQTTNEISHHGYTMFYRKGRRKCKAKKYFTKDNYDI